MLAKVGFLHHFLISLSPNFNVIVGKVVAKSYEMHKTMICYNGRLWENIYVSLPYCMHGSRVYKHFGMRNGCRVNNTFILDARQP